MISDITLISFPHKHASDGNIRVDGIARQTNSVPNTNITVKQSNLTISVIAND